MTQNQISYAKAKEEARHNLATENELSRHNVSVENETVRHNIVGEQQAEKQLVINQGVLDETRRHNVSSENELNRHNVIVEKQSADVLNETVRHNKESESELNRHNVAVESESQRHNLASEKEATRSNKINESIKQYQAETQRFDSTKATVVGAISDIIDPGEKTYTKSSLGTASEASGLTPQQKEDVKAKLRSLRKPSNNKSSGFVETFIGQMKTNIMNTTSFNALIN